jgi:AAA domain
MTTRPLPPNIEELISGSPIRHGNGGMPPMDNAPSAMSPDDYGVSSIPGLGQSKGRSKAPLRDDWRQNVVTSDRLQGMTFAPITFVVPGLIPAEGATLICSKPKVGKSWLVLDVAISATMDRFVLGDLKAKQGDVLYLALEDSHRRLQSRMTRVLGAFRETWPPGLTLATAWARVDQGGCEDIRTWVLERRAAGRSVSFVAIDVLKIMRPPPKSGQTPYDADYDAVRALQQLSLELGIAILIIHHTRKAEADDLMDKVSGTYGIVGAGDTIIVIDRQTNGMVFDVRGRDVEANTFAVEFNKALCRWTILGDAEAVHQSQERKVILAIFRQADGPLSAAEVIDAGTRMEIWTSPPSHEAAKKMLQRLAAEGVLQKAGRGKYEYRDDPPRQSPDVPMEEQDWNEFE